jgi:hypothetical protein
MTEQKLGNAIQFHSQRGSGMMSGGRLKQVDELLKVILCRKG